jgi:hypothetical protein
MTTAPERPLLHAYEGENPFDIVDSAWGSLERWRVVALQTGEASGLTAIADHVRSDAVTAMDALEERERTVIEREQACDARERAHAVSITRFVDFVGQAASLFDRIEKLRADQQEEPLASPPGAAIDPSKEPEPELEIEDTVQPAHGDPPGALPPSLQIKKSFTPANCPLRRSPHSPSPPD